MGQQVHARIWQPSLRDNLTPLAPCSRVVLRVMEVPQLPVALEALGNAGEALWAARRVTPRMALLCTARPLSFTWTPDGRGIVAVSATSSKAPGQMPARRAAVCLMYVSKHTGSSLASGLVFLLQARACSNLLVS